MNTPHSRAASIVMLAALAATAAGGAAAGEKKPAGEGVEVRLLLTIRESGKKAALAGASVQRFSDDKWRDFGGAACRSKDKFTAVKTQQANYSGHDRTPVGKREKAVLFRAVKEGYESAYFAADHKAAKANPKYYKEISLRRHGQVGCWPLDDGKGENAREATGKGNAGKISGATWVKEDGRPLLEFDGEDDFVDCDASPAYECGEAITVLLWVRPAEKVSTMQGLAGRAWSNPYSLSTVKNNGLHASVFLWGFGRAYLIKRNVLKPGQWNLVGFSYGDYRLSLFHNGKEVREGASFMRGFKKQQERSLEGQLSLAKRIKLPWDRYAQPYRIHEPSGQPLSIGYFDGAAPFKGAMRGVRIYNYALSEKEVEKVYKAEGRK